MSVSTWEHNLINQLYIMNHLLEYYFCFGSFVCFERIQFVHSLVRRVFFFFQRFNASWMRVEFKQ